MKRRSIPERYADLASDKWYEPTQCHCFKCFEREVAKAIRRAIAADRRARRKR